jgi:gliding motility-associated-like protein
MKKTITLFLLFIGLHTYSQKQANVWYFGQNAGIDFNFTPPKALLDGELSTLEGCSTFSDADGNLLFYSDGITVWDKNHDIMTYTDGSLGDNLLGDPSAAQSGMIIPKPSSDSIYYLFTVTDNNSSKGFNYYTIDMSLNGGSGQLIDENSDGSFFVELQGGNWTEKVAAVKGQQCNTFWVVTAFNNNFYSYLVDSNGVDSTPIISNVSTRVDERGYLKLSPDGTKLAVANQGPEEAILYNFNSLTGEVINDEIFVVGGFPGDGQPYGAEFSVDSKKLYISTVSGFRFPNAPPVDYKLFQFDLTATNIPDSKFLIHEQIGGSFEYPDGGFRGAIQLGPDGKIYATIPTTYAQPAGFATFLDVIENPTADAADIIFTKDAIDLDGRLSTQGLPPFISSLLLPIDISDDSGTTINNQELKYCIGDNVTFVITDPDVIAGGSTPTFEWSFNDGTTTTIISSSDSLELLNLTTANNGTYTLKIELTNSCGDITEYNAIFNIEVFEPAIASTPDDINRCDTDRDGYIQFDLATEQNSTILSGFDPSVDLTAFEVIYYNDEDEANTGGVSIPNLYTNQNAFIEEIIYARVQNIAAPNTCFAITSFKLKVTDIPTPTQPTEYRVCDDTTSAGGDTDGVSSFLLNTKDAEILTGVTNPSDYYISYHTDILDAQTSSTSNAIDKDTDYPVTNSQTVYVRVENIANADCNAISDDSVGSTFKSFKLIVDATPVVITAPSDINRCDEDRAGFLDFDLQADQTPQILNGLDPSLDTSAFEVLYFDNLPDAEANTTANIIANPYRVNTSNNPTIYARIHNSNNTTCFTTVEFKLKVTDTPTPTQPTVYRLCDDTASGSDTDGKSSFLLNTKDAEILTDVTNPGEYTISYHTDILDAQTSSTTNAIDKDADYQITTSQTVYVRIENNNDPTLCYTVSDDSASSTFKSFELIVDPLPVVNTGVEINYCIVTGDPNPTVDLTQAENQISSTTNASFEYFKDLAGTDLILDPVSYPPVGNVLQSVYVKVISDQGCARDLVELVLNIGETPNNSFDDLVAIECDDFLDQDGNDTPAMNDDTDNITNFSLDLTAIIAAINPPINTEVFFYESTSDRNSNSNNIPDLTNYRNNPTNIDITVVPDGIRFPIYYKILSTINNDCEGIGQFYLQINQVPTVNPYGDLILCDDGDDGDFVNGIVQTFDLESQTPIILGTQDPLNFTVSYHLTDLDALSGASPIMNTSMYENITPNLQTIYVRVTNNTTGCFTNHTSFDLIVNPLPIANFVDDLEICDDNTDGSAQNGFSQSFDLELQTAGILGTQDPTQFSVTYHASLADAQAGTLPLGSPFSNSVPFSQIIYARVYNSLTGCANGISNFNAIVNPEPTTENASNLSYCDDDSDGDDTNGFVQNIDLDSQITDILGPLQDPDDFNVTFHETQTDATDGTDALSSPYTNTTANQQTIYVRVENKDTGCVNDDFTFDVIVNPLPKFKVTSPQIVCLSGPPLTLFIENPDAVYDYVWTAPNGEESFGEEITITSGGLYTVTATTTNGTGCTRTREIQVNESIVATITEADVTIVDDSDNNSITIDPTNLGIGDYQYALINENGLQTAFQDIPVFENLSGGFYTIVVQDKNGCRPDANLIVSVIEYPKFFTPNNDGINDTWAIKGANSTFYPSAQINIFNRFGKIVAQIDVDNPGWDGTYGGKRLPSDDYWFSIMLVDRNGNARERKGNFSMLRR